jgi:type I restriction enzyme S subunit
VSARIGWKALTAAEYVPEGYVFLATPNIKTAAIDFGNVNYISEFRYKESPELALQLGDVLLAKDGSLGVTNVVTELPRPATVNSSVAVLRPHGIDAAFLRYVLASGPITNLIAAVKNGMGVPHLFQSDIRRLPIPVPTAPMQRAIADYLDRETARIDSLIGMKERLVQLHREAFFALLDFLTRPLGPKTVRVRRLIDGITTGSRDWGDRVGSGAGWFFRSMNLREGRSDPLVEGDRLATIDPPDNAEARRAALKFGDVLVGVTGANTGWVCHWKGDVSPIYVSQHVAALRPRNDVNSLWLAYSLLAPSAQGQIRAHQYGGTKQGLGLDELRNLEVRSCPRDDQDRDAERMNRVEQKLRAVETLLSQQVAVLQERRHTLITSAVTGLLDLGGIA